MPLKACVKSLSTLTIEFIVDNMDEFCKPTSIDFTNLKIKRFPLTSNILLKIMSRLKGKNQLRDQYINLLLTPHLRKLDLSMADNNSMADLLDIASEECPKLTCLWIGSLAVDLCDCLSFIAKFKHLQVLDISGSVPANDLLALLGTYCEHLRELHMGNSRVSDEGIYGLCVTGKCKSLKILNILNLTETRVSTIGLQMVLNNVPVLEDLRHDALVGTLSDLHQLALREQVGNVKFQLLVLTLWNTSTYRSGNLSQAVSCCPFLGKVKITPPPDFTDVDLLDLLQAKNLHDLTISGTETGQISFERGVSLLLRESSFGESLKSLILVDVVDLNVRVIIQCCPNLSILTLNMGCGEIHYNDDRNIDAIDFVALRKLETLKVVRCNCTKNLLWLLSSPFLVSVTLYYCNALSDELIGEVHKIHSFMTLEHFEVNVNSRITKDGIDVLMSEANPLKVIKLRDCTRLTTTNIDDWKKEIRDENWDLSMLE